MSGFLFVQQGNVGEQWQLVTGDRVPLAVELQSVSVAPPDASAVTYTPATPANWPSPAPANVAAALDLLGAPHATNLANALRVPLAGDAQSNTIGPFAVVPQKSGVYLCFAAVELDSAAAPTGAAVARLSIRVDGVAVNTAIGQGYSPGAFTQNLSTLGLVTVNRLLSHNWDLVLDTGSALSPAHIDADQAKLVLVEL